MRRRLSFQWCRSNTDEKFKGSAVADCTIRRSLGFANELFSNKQKQKQSNFIAMQFPCEHYKTSKNKGLGGEI